MSTNSLANQFTDKDIAFIQLVMEEVLNARGGGPMSGIEVYESTKNCLSRNFPENTFRNALSAAVRTGKITGIVGKRGKGAGYFLSNLMPEAKQKNISSSSNNNKNKIDISSIQEKFNSNNESVKNIIVIKGNKISVNLSLTKLRIFLLQVLQAKENSSGCVKFDNKTFICDYELLERFLFNFCAASIVNDDFDNDDSDDENY